MSLSHIPPEHLSFQIQFQHPQKSFGGLPGKLPEEALAALFGISLEEYRQQVAGFQANAHRAAMELLSLDGFANRVDQLPFAPGSSVVGLGDSITDDLQSWFEILGQMLVIRRPRDEIRLINAGISGDTTANATSRFLEVVMERPDWVICMLGTNDARRHGLSPTKPLVSLEETHQNLGMLRHFAASQTQARWVWMTPTPVIEAQIPRHFLLGPGQMRWKNEQLAAIADLIRQMPEPVVDLQAAFGYPQPTSPALLLPDGLHPALEGQKVIARALVERLASLS
jgi:acyl-CoA thioesterase I